MDVVQTLDGRRNMYDPDELEEEQRERERRNKVNREYKDFVARVTELWERDLPEAHLEFDIPFKVGSVLRLPCSTCRTILMPLALTLEAD